MAAEAILVSVDEFAKLKPDQRKKTVLLHLTEEDFAQLTKGMKPETGFPPTGAGLQIIPLSAARGYIGILRCGLDEVPYPDPSGTWRCIGTPSDPTDPPPQLTPGTGCEWTITRGRFTCTGTCSGGVRCVGRLQLVSWGFFIGCRCPMRPPAPVA